MLTAGWDVTSSWEPTAIEGMMRRSAPRFEDQRGAFTELWRESLTAQLGDERFVQANLSRSRAGVLRGMHFHRRQVDLWVLIEGRAIVANTDLRPLFDAASADVTKANAAKRPQSQVLTLEPGDALYIPRLVAHGFWAPEDMALAYLVSNEYDSSDELGFAWDDPAVGIDWPDRAPTLSDRDRATPSLNDAVAQLRQS
jgi:dTDP-4-dehydrorhamnose 3,5-epimerase